MMGMAMMAVDGHTPLQLRYRLLCDVSTDHRIARRIARPTALLAADNIFHTGVDRLLQSDR